MPTREERMLTASLGDGIAERMASALARIPLLLVQIPVTRSAAVTEDVGYRL